MTLFICRIMEVRNWQLAAEIDTAHRHQLVLSRSFLFMVIYAPLSFRRWFSPGLV